MGLDKPSIKMAEQVETLDKELLVEKVEGIADDMVMEQITGA